MNVIDLRKMSMDDLKKEHLALLREKFNLRMQKGSGELTRTHVIKQARRKLARVLTILAERQETNNE